MEAFIGGVVVVAVAASTIISGVGSAIRPFAKEVIKGGIVTYNAVPEMVSETKEQFNDIVAKAKAEISEPASKAHPAKTHHA